MHKLVMAIFVGLLVCTAACETKEERVLPKTAAVTAAMPALAVQENSMSERDEFVSKAQKEMDELNLKLAALRSKAVSASGKARARLEQQIAELESERKNVEAKLADLKSAMGETWKEFKEAVTAAISRLRQSVQKAG